MSNENNTPVAVLRRGGLKVSIWGNRNEEGRTRYSTGGVVRSYRDEQGEWQESRSLSNGELLQAARLLQLADDHIWELRAADKEAQQ